jgi:hypothetical protein
MHRVAVPRLGQLVGVGFGQIQHGDILSPTFF